MTSLLTVNKERKHLLKLRREARSKQCEKDLRQLLWETW